MCPGQAEEVFSYMAGDFMRPVVDIVDQLLTAGMNVTVYNGQLDLIVDTIGNLIRALPSDQLRQQRLNPPTYRIPPEKSCAT